MLQDKTNSHSWILIREISVVVADLYLQLIASSHSYVFIERQFNAFNDYLIGAEFRVVGVL